jgi:hypothetical protein
VLLPLLLTLVGALAAVLPAPLGFPDLPDFVPLGLLGAGAAWAWFVPWKRPRRRRLFAITQTLLALGFAYWMLVFSAYGDAPNAPLPGDPAPDISAVRVRDGARFDLVAERGHPLLLVFFRGKW